jgi:hypothetical protein
MKTQERFSSFAIGIEMEVKELDEPLNQMRRNRSSSKISP